MQAAKFAVLQLKIWGEKAKVLVEERTKQRAALEAKLLCCPTQHFHNAGIRILCVL